MLLIYYNPHTNSFYTKFTQNFWKESAKVGYTNQYDHFIVQIIYFTDDNQALSVLSHDDYYFNKKHESALQKQKTLKFKLINRVIGLLYRFRDKR